MTMAKNKEIRKVTIVSLDSSARVGPLCILRVGSNVIATDYAAGVAHNASE